MLERIAAAACPQPEDLVIEIGPGRGALPRKLLQRAARVVAVEVDPFLAGWLRRDFADEPRLEIVEADVLELDLARFGRAADRRQPALLHHLADSRPSRPPGAAARRVSGSERSGFAPGGPSRRSATTDS